MLKRLADNARAILLPDSGVGLAERFYEGICVASALLAFGLVLPINAFQRIPASVSIAAGAFGALATFLYWLSRKGRYYPTLLLTGYLAALAFIWFPNAGSRGSVPYYFFAALGFALVFFSGWRRWAFSVIAVATCIGLIALESSYPGLLQDFPSDADRRWDLAGGFVIAAIGYAMLLLVVMAVYSRERERQQATMQALAEAERQASLLFDVNPDAVVLLDFDRRVFLDVNQGFLRLTGWSRDEVVGRSTLDVGVWANPADREATNELLSRSGRLEGRLERFRRKDGSELWGALSVQVIDRGDQRAFLMTTRDVTAEIEAQMAVAESRAVLSALIDSTEDVVWLVSPGEWRLVTFNKAFVQITRETFGIEPRVGMTPAEILPADGAEMWAGMFRRAVDEGAFTFEYAVPGATRVVLHTVNPVRHGEAVMGVSVFGKDVTLLKNAEREREHLAQQVRESQKLESLGRLAGGVAHDFNNMLAGIMGYAELLREDEQDPVRREHLAAILNAAERSAEMTRKLLAFGRRGKNIAEAVDLNQIVRDCLTMLKPSMRAHVDVRMALDATWPVDGDPSQINQVVVNLCLNACDAMPGGGTLTVKTADVPGAAGLDPALGLPPDDHVVLRVADTGIGMSDEVRARIFEPFFTTKARSHSSGTGLGLSTVYGIVQLHRGAIMVESQPGAGARFTTALPRGTLGPRARPARVEVPPGRGVILVVEDEPAIRRVTMEALGRLGYLTIPAEDGDEAIRVYADRGKDISAVLLDLKMPRKDGRETFIALRAMDPTVAVLICSGYGENDEAQGLIELGARGLLAKPFRLRELATQLAGLV